MVDENEITKQAIAQGKQIVERASAEAQAIADSAYNYSDNLLETVEKVVIGSMKEFEQCIAIVRNNRNELHGGHSRQMEALTPDEEVQQ